MLLNLRRRAISLRTCLVALMMVASVPMALFMSVQIVRDAQGEMQRMAAQLEATTAAAAAAVERELTASAESLALLAHASVLRAGDVEGFGAMLRSWPQPLLRRSWDAVFVLDERLQRSVYSSGPAPWQWPDGGGTADGGRLRVTGLVRSPDGTWAMAVAVRVGDGPYWLGAWIEAAYWQALLERTSLPEGGFATLYDGEHRIIARTMSPGRFVGGMLPPGAVARMGTRASGVHRAELLEGGDTYAAWQRLSQGGWGVGAGVPAQPLEARATQSMLRAFGIAAACLLAGVFIALRLARQVTRPLAALGAGQPWDGVLAVREVASLRDALGEVRAGEAAARQRLQHKADEFAAVFDGSPIGLAFAQDSSARQRRFNPALQSLLQPPEGGGAVQVSQDGQVIGFEQTPLAVAASTGRPVGATTLELRWEGSDALRIVVVQAVPLRDADGRPRGAIAAVVDVTDRQRAEQAAQRANEAKDRFLAMLSHELRNPLNAITSAAEVLQLLGDAGAQRTEAADARGIIARQTRHLAHLVADLLDMARVVAGDVTLAPAPLDLAALAAEQAARQAAAPGLAAHRVVLDLHAAWTVADRARMAQVLLNLLENARKYTPAGGSITLTTRSEHGRAVLEVSDTGRGIPAELQAQAFDAFVQGERRLDRQEGGLGLGLALVQRIVQLHGGTVGVRSSGQGSVFRVELPGAEPPRSDEPAGNPRRATPRHVLLIDDNADALQALRSALVLEGHEVHCASDGDQGLRRLLARRPEVAVIDLGLPGLDGYEVARRSRAAGFAGCLVALSGYSSQRDVRTAMKAGFDVQLPKPVDFARLREVLARPL
ncbi:ATP-binding protein [Aquincola sp. MAHUQ-54]|uniref:histidine kinase n=1 Tax=Aquincola agrisoli TaxID=3119538 RepID=A0AAW9QJZ2_9BURK